LPRGTQGPYNDIQTIELASSTTVGELTAIMTSFETLKTDGLSPTSASALASFENSLVTAYAAAPTTTLTNNSTYLPQFEALYTSSSTTLSPQQTTDLTTAYNALAAAVMSANITTADITLINSDYANVLLAAGNTTTPAPTYPYFSLVTGRTEGVGEGVGGGIGGGCG